MNTDQRHRSCSRCGWGAEEKVRSQIGRPGGLPATESDPPGWPLLDARECTLLDRQSAPPLAASNWQPPSPAPRTGQAVSSPPRGVELAASLSSPKNWRGTFGDPKVVQTKLFASAAPSRSRLDRHWLLRSCRGFGTFWSTKSSYSEDIKSTFLWPSI